MSFVSFLSRPVRRRHVITTRTARKIAAGGGALVLLLATGSPALARLPGPPPPPPNPSTSVSVGPNDDGILKRDPDGSCTTPADITLPEVLQAPTQVGGREVWAVSCAYKTFTTDNKLLSDTDVCIYDGTNWIFIGLTRSDETGYKWNQFTRSYLHPHRVDVPQPCIEG